MYGLCGDVFFERVSLPKVASAAHQSALMALLLPSSCWVCRGNQSFVNVVWMLQNFKNAIWNVTGFEQFGGANCRNPILQPTVDTALLKQGREVTR